MKPDLPALRCQSGLLNMAEEQSDKKEEDTLIT